MQHDHSHLSKGASTLLKLATVLTIIGALNWGLVGFFNWNLVDAIFGGGAREMTSTASRVVYALVGLAGIAAAYLLSQFGAMERHEMQRHDVAAAPPSR